VETVISRRLDHYHPHFGSASISMRARREILPAKATVKVFISWGRFA